MFLKSIPIEDVGWFTRVLSNSKLSLYFLKEVSDFEKSKLIFKTLSFFNKLI